MTSSRALEAREPPTEPSSERISERRYRLMAQNFPGAVAMYDRELRFLFVEGPVLERLGFPAATLEGRTLREVTPPERYAQIEPVYRSALEGRTTVRELDVGGVVFEIRHEPVRDDDGELVGGLLLAVDISERRRAEELARKAEVSLQQQSRLLETLMQNASLGLVMMDAQQHCTFMNPAAERIFGLTFEEVRRLGKPLHDIVHHTRPDGRAYPIAECPIDRALPTRMRETGEDVFVRPDGSFYPVAFTASPILEGGRPVGTVIEVRDTTEDKAAEARLREHAETLAILNRIGQQLQSELDPDKLVQAVTDAATRLAGAQFGAFFYNVIDARGESYVLYAISGVPREAFSKFPLPRNTKIFGPTFAGERVVRVDDIRKDPNYGHNAPYHGMPEGHLPVTSYLAVPVISRSGKVIGGLFFGHEQPGVFSEHAEKLVVGLAAQAAVAMDNSALYRSERHAARLAEFERNRLRSLLQQLPAGVAVSWGPEHRFAWANETHARVVGRDVAGRTAAEAFPELAGTPFFATLDEVYRSGRPASVQELPLAHVRGGRAPEDLEGFYDFTYQPILDVAGKVEGILTFCIDVTGPVLARNRVELLAGELSRAVAEERAAASERERLIQRLERTNAELDQFAYVASHDLKAPLRGISNLSQWIEDDLAAVLTDETRQQMALLRGRVVRLEELINGILRYSRAGRAKDAPVHVELAELCRTVWELLAPDPGATLVLDGPFPELVTERLPLEQVLQNLLSNAVKYGGERPTVTVSVVEDADHVEIAVRDDGPGIAPAYHERIWGIFQTLAARDEVEGTGIGLSIVRKIVENKGGRAWVESTPGEGACFRFTWPVHDRGDVARS